MSALLGLVIVPDEIHSKRGHVQCRRCKTPAPSLDGRIYECARCSASASRQDLQRAYCGSTTPDRSEAERMREILRRVNARGYRA